MAKNPVPAPKLHINLLYPQGLPMKLPLKFLKWVLDYGRFIVIFVEILVVATFITRFKYDAQLADINEKINNEQIPFIESLAGDELLIRQTQFKINTIGQNYSATPNWANLLAKIASLTPTGVKFTLETLDHTESSNSSLKFKITGAANASNDLAIFSSNLRKDETFSQINITNINYTQGTLGFTIIGVTAK